MRSGCGVAGVVTLLCRAFYRTWRMCRQIQLAGWAC